MTNQFLNAAKEAEMKGQHVDDPSSEAGQAINEGAIYLETLGNMDKLHKDWYYKTIEAYKQNPDAYNPSFWAKMNEFDKLETIQDRDKWMRENDPLQAAWNTDAFMERNIVGTYTSTYSGITSGSETTKLRKEDVEKTLAADRLTPEGKRDNLAGIQAGTWKDEKSQVEWFYNKKSAEEPGSKSTTKKAGPNSGGGSGWGSGGSYSTDDFTFTPSRKPSVNNSTMSTTDWKKEDTGQNWDGTVQQVDVGAKGKEIPPMYMNYSDGTEGYVQPTGFEKRGNDWYIVGRKFQEKGAQKMTQNEFDQLSADKKKNAFFDSSTGQVTFFEVLENTTLPYSGNEQNIRSKIPGFDLPTYVREATAKLQAEADKNTNKAWKEHYQAKILDFSDKSEDALMGRINALQSQGYTGVQTKRGKNAAGNVTTYLVFRGNGETYSYDMNDEIDQITLKSYFEQ